MATFVKRKTKKSGYTWKVIIRVQGYPTICKNFSRKQEAEDWSSEIEGQIRRGQYSFSKINKHATLEEVVQRYEDDGVLSHHRSVRDTRRHLSYWKERFKGYAIIHITTEMVAKERKILLTESTEHGKTRQPGTVNRYLASLSSIFSYAVKTLRWIDENPCRNLVKRKEPMGRDRILSVDESAQLLEACKQSKNGYLYAIVLMALTTGMRQGEILSLTWNDVDLDAGICHIRMSKNGRPRSAALSDSMIQALKRVYERRQPNKALVFASRTAFGMLDIRKAFSAALRKLGITNFRFHDLRHTFATMVAGMGASQIQMKACTGHRTLEMLQRYTHLDVNETRQYTHQISNLLTHEVENE